MCECLFFPSVTYASQYAVRFCPSSFAVNGGSMFMAAFDSLLLCFWLFFDEFYAHMEIMICASLAFCIFFVFGPGTPFDTSEFD
jgi:hypothetical protein